MAYSKSISKGQFPIHCQLCEIEQIISNKCLDCDLLMCNKCKNKVHSKFKHFKNHRIIDIKDVGKETEEKLNFDNINCKQHAGQSCCLFCQTCDSLVCPSCVAKDHKKHDLMEINEAYDKKIKTLKITQEQFQEKENKMNEQKIRLKQLKTAETSKYDKVNQEILNHGRELKQFVDTHIDNLQKELQDSRNVIQQSIDIELDIIEKTSQQCDVNKQKTHDLINTTDVARFFEEVDDIEKLTDPSLIPQIKSTYPSTPTFIPGEITQGYVGMLQTDNKQLEVKLSIVQEFKTDLPEIIEHVCPCPDNSVWINAIETLQKVKHLGSSLQILSSHNITVYGMAITPNNDLLLATDGTRLKQIRNNTETIQDSIYNIDPFQPTSVHVSNDFKVMVGGIAEDEERQVLIRMNQKGEQQNIYEHDKQNQPLFGKYPWGITSTSNDLIFVADYYQDGGDGRLVILDQTGDVQYYTGHPEVNKNRSFQAIGLTTTPNDNVIVADAGTDTLHILNNLGQFLTNFDTKDIGIEHPYSLSFSLSGQFYIGCVRHKGSTDNAKLYEVNINGC